MKKTIAILVGAAGLILAPYCFREAHAQYTQPAPIEKVATGTMLQADILALNVTPFPVIPAQGAGTVILLDNIFMEMVRGSATKYAAGAQQTLRYSNHAGALAVNSSTVCFAGFITSLGSGDGTCFSVGMTLATGTSLPSNYVNVPVVFDIASPAFTCADTCGTIKYWITYHVANGVI